MMKRTLKLKNCRRNQFMMIQFIKNREMAIVIFIANHKTIQIQIFKTEKYIIKLKDKH